MLLDNVNRTGANAIVDVVVIEDRPLYVEALLSLLSVALSGRKIERFRDIESAESLLRGHIAAKATDPSCLSCDG